MHIMMRYTVHRKQTKLFMVACRGYLEKRSLDKNGVMLAALRLDFCQACLQSFISICGMYFFPKLKVSLLLYVWHGKLLWTNACRLSGLYGWKL